MCLVNALWFNNLQDLTRTYCMYIEGAILGRGFAGVKFRKNCLQTLRTKFLQVSSSVSFACSWSRNIKQTCLHLTLQLQITHSYTHTCTVTQVYSVHMHSYTTMSLSSTTKFVNFIFTNSNSILASPQKRNNSKQAIISYSALQP